MIKMNVPSDPLVPQEGPFEIFSSTVRSGLSDIRKAMKLDSGNWKYWQIERSKHHNYLPTCLIKNQRYLIPMALASSIPLLFHDISSAISCLQILLETVSKSHL